MGESENVLSAME